jgi:hypothetical protein
MTEVKAEYVTEAEDERKHYHDCGHLIGVEVDGVIIRKGDIYYSLLLVCPDCRTLITWRADRLKALLARYKRRQSGLLEELEAPLIILETDC